MSLEADLTACPKVLLHDHLDGGLRPATVLELADECGYTGLPTSDLESLEEWFYQGRSASLERYLEAFRHTVAVLQTASALDRAAYEAAEDLAADGVVYAEIRMAPSLCTEGGLSREAAIEAMLSGLRRGTSDFGIETRLIIDAMRQDSDSAEVARAALEFRDAGVVAFDLAGPEAGFPATDHFTACTMIRDGGLHLTIHAGEGAGIDSIRDALDAGAERLGHGARIIEDVVVRDGAIVELGALAQRVHDQQIPLELCPTSNLHTGMYPSSSDHPIGMLHRAGFAVTINTDNRLMSRVRVSDELALVIETHGFERSDLAAMSQRAVEGAFCDDETRGRIRSRVADFYS